MLQVYVDSNVLPPEVASLSTVGELVEYVKSTIDPSTIIVSLSKDNEPLTDSDWKRSISSLKDSTLEIKTGSKMDFIHNRLQSVTELVEAVIQNVSDISGLFKANRSLDANTNFSATLEDLNALFNWMYSILAMDPDKFALEVNEFSGLVRDLKYACGQMQQQQLFQSWWALGETLDKKVLPLLESVKDVGLRAENKAV